MLQATNIQVTLNKRTLAQDISFQLMPGSISAILGPNGAGKSTLLKTLFGDLPLSSGHIEFDGQRLQTNQLTKWRSLFGYMPQDINLDVSLSVIEVVLMGRLDSLSLRIDDELLNQGLQILDSIGMQSLAARDVRSLSGGQRQMILFAQAIMRNPSILLLDEPVSALDLHHQHILMQHLRTQTRQNQYITLMVLHDLNLAAQYADNLLVIKNGQLLTSGAPQHILNAPLIESVYGVKADVLHDKHGTPFVRTLKASR